MDHTGGAPPDGNLRVGFDRRLKLEFHESRMTSAPRLLA